MSGIPDLLGDRCAQAGCISRESNLGDKGARTSPSSSTSTTTSYPVPDIVMQGSGGRGGERKWCILESGSWNIPGLR